MEQREEKSKGQKGKKNDIETMKLMFVPIRSCFCTFGLVGRAASREGWQAAHPNDYAHEEQDGDEPSGDQEQEQDSTIEARPDQSLIS